MAASTIAASHAAPVVTHKWLIAIAVMLGAALEILDTSIVNVALPYMQGSFAAGVDEITWVITSYLVANGIMIPLTGWISARFGRKRYFLFSVVLFATASALCGAAQTLGEMVLFRLIQGAAGAAMIPSSQAILMETFPPQEQALAMATWGIGLMVAPILGPTLGGWITENWNWRWNFYINIPACVLAAVMVYLFVHDPAYMANREQRERRVDWLGIGCLVVSLGMLQIVLDRGQRSDWFAAPWVCYFTLLAAGAALLLIFHEMRTPDPILDFRMLKIREFTLSVTLITVLMSVLYGVNLLNPLFLQELMGYTAWKAGEALGPRGFAVAAAMLVVGQLGRLGYDSRPLIGLGFLICAWAGWHMADWDLTVSMFSLMAPIMVFGVGAGLIFPVLSARALADIPRERIGYGSSLYNMMRNTGAAVGVSLVGNMITNREQVHQTYLVQHITASEAWQLESRAPHLSTLPSLNFMHQMITNQKQGLEMIYRMIEAQAQLLAFNDTYRFFAYIMLLSAPLCLLCKRMKFQGGGGGH